MADEVDTPPVISTGRAYAEVLLVYVAVFGASIGLAAASLTNDLPPISALTWGEGASDAFGEVTTAAIVIALVLLLCRRRGLTAADVGYRMPDNTRRLPAWTGVARSGAWAILALLLGGAVTSALETGKNNLHVLSGSGLLAGVGAAINAGFIEETVALAFVVVTLQQAKRPTLEIGIVAVLLRMAYHIYYGPGVLGVALWATIFLLVFLQTRSVVALILVHVGWDTCAYLNLMFGKRVGGIEVAAFFVIWILALILWRADKSRLTTTL